MKFYGKAEQAANKILQAFESGNIPQALSRVFIRLNCPDDMPSKKWSWRNRLLIALDGHIDARGYRQWETVNRNVKKGQHASHILAPVFVKAKENDEKRNVKEGDMVLIGFKSIPVFGYEQTEGEELPYMAEQTKFLDRLPLVDVARHWGLNVSVYEGEEKAYLGYYKRGQGIAVGVENIAVWTHELIHAADHKAGTIDEKSGTLNNEVVAELGANVLLECLGMESAADTGHAWAYIQHYCLEHKRKPLSVCSELLDRVCNAVALVLDTAEEIKKQIAA